MLGLLCLCMCVARSALCVHVCRSVCLVCAGVLICLPCVSADRSALCVPVLCVHVSVGLPCV